MAIEIGGRKFTNPEDIKEYTREVWCDVGRIDDAGDFDFTVLNVGTIRFQSHKFIEKELQRVDDWSFVAMAGLAAIYCKRKGDAK